MKPGDLVRLKAAKKYGIVLKELGDGVFSVLWYHGKVTEYSSEYMIKI